MHKLPKMILLSCVVGLILISAGACSLLYVNRLGPATPTSGIATVNQVWDIIHSDYVDRSRLDDTKLGDAAIKGIVTELNDPHSAYMDPTTFKEFSSGLTGNFEGIGASIAERDGQIVVVNPLPGSPAQKAGIQSGDVILNINGVSTQGITAEQAVAKVRGPAGTTVTLTLQHADQSASFDITITREAISLPSVNLVMKDRIAYIQIVEFSDTTDGQLGAALDSLTQQKSTGIILDIRDNPGGSVDAVVAIASRFIQSGVILYVVDNDGKQTAMEVNHTGTTTELPLVVLVNQNSASASEVLTGALKDTGRAVIAGAVTFGKGSVNNLYELNDGSALYLTTGRWLTPKGTLIEGKGITPDYQIDVQGDAAITWAIDYLNMQPAPSPMMRQPVSEVMAG
jgi:carboxyl-terminal processing protease